jgi:hypothetical protein
MGIARSTYYDRSEKPADCSAGRSIMCIHKPDQRNHRTTHPKTARLAEALENLVGWFSSPSL